MFLLDTNVVSELLKPQPHAAIADWFEAVPAQGFAVSTITKAELLYGVALLPESRRRRQIHGYIDDFFAILPPSALLPFDDACCNHFAVLAAATRERLRSHRTLDVLIASIAMAGSRTVVTRNVRDFQPLGVPLLDPWASPSS